MMKNQQKYLISDIGVATNTLQLKEAQQKLLYENYLKGTDDKFSRTQSQKKIYRNYSQNPQKYQLNLNYEVMNKNTRLNQMIKNQLASSYQQEIERKSRQRIQQRERKKMQQQQMIRAAKNQIWWDKQKTKQAAYEFKKQAIQAINQKQRRKIYQKQYQQIQKQMFQKKFQHSLTIKHKQNTFKKHYVNVNKDQQMNQINYLQSAAVMDKIIEDKKERLVQHLIEDNQRRLRQKAQREFTEAQKNRRDLNQQLLCQIKQKQMRKKQQLNEMRSQYYTSDPYTKKHHPINNPIDFKVNHDSKYIMKQLKSGLARSGSQSLIS